MGRFVRKSCLLLCLAIAAFATYGQCSNEADLEDAGTNVTIPTDGSCDSPGDDGLTCNLNATFWDFDGNLTVLSCATVNFRCDKHDHEDGRLCNRISTA